MHDFGSLRDRRPLWQQKSPSVALGWNAFPPRTCGAPLAESIPRRTDKPAVFADNDMSETQRHQSGGFISGRGCRFPASVPGGSTHTLGKTRTATSRDQSSIIQTSIAALLT